MKEEREKKRNEGKKKSERGKEKEKKEEGKIERKVEEKKEKETYLGTDQRGRGLMRKGGQRKEDQKRVAWKKRRGWKSG